ncbi:MAG: hypothetical protein KGZ68_12250 [Dechloromonas sp.]|nr:hypothetical protein [Dechloromonas sp.]
MTSVKYFHSAMTDAPVLNGTAGSLIGVLDACLVNGFSLRTVDSLTVAANVATANISAGHGYEPDTIVLIAGATPAGLNGEKRVLSATTNTITFAAPGIADTTATGAINARLAPAGWEKPFSGTNLAVYRSANVAGTREFLRVDDTGTTDARVVGYESMTDVNTGTGPFPTNTQRSGGLWWPKASAAAGVARAWTVIADDRAFYVFVNTSTNGAGVMPNSYGWVFGDFNSAKSGDAFGCYITGHSASAGAITSSLGSGISYSGTSANEGFVARAFTAIGGSLQIIRQIEYPNTNNTHPGAVGLFTYPNGPDNGLYLAPAFLYEGSTGNRGRLRGLLYPCHTLADTTFNWRDKIDGQGAYAGRKLLAVKSIGVPNTAAATAATIFFDITGPW